MTLLSILKPGDAVDAPAVTPTIAARAYCTGLKDGQAGEAKRQAQEAELFRRELAAVLDTLLDALIDEDRARTIVWAGVASRMVSAGR